MAATGTDSTVATSGDVGMGRRRGKSKAANFKYDGPVSVIRLELDVSDIGVRWRLGRQWEAVFRLRRALQRDAADRCRAYWAAHHERRRDPKALRERLGFSRKGIEAAAKSHIEASGWMRDHLTKAVGLHVADEVWETVDRRCSPTPRGAGMDRRGSDHGGSSLVFRVGPAHIPRPGRCGKPTGWSAPSTGTFRHTGTLSCPRR